MTDSPPDLTTLLDRIGTLFDDIVFPMLAAWLIYILKSFLISFVSRFRPPSTPPEQGG